MALEVEVPHLQSDNQVPTTPSPAPQVELLTPWNEAAQRIRVASLSHYIHAVVVTIEDFFVENKPAEGMDLCLAVAMLPDGESIVQAELQPNPLSPSDLTSLLNQVESLPRRRCEGGPSPFS